MGYKFYVHDGLDQTYLSFLVISERHSDTPEQTYESIKDVQSSHAKGESNQPVWG